MLKNILLLLIRLYQKTLSPDHGLLRLFFAPGVCIYRPTCSEYAYDAINQYGTIRGIILSAKRLLRCHPWHEGGYDPVIMSKSKIQMSNQCQTTKCLNTYGRTEELKNCSSVPRFFGSSVFWHLSFDI